MKRSFVFNLEPLNRIFYLFYITIIPLISLGLLKKYCWKVIIFFVFQKLLNANFVYI